MNKDIYNKVNERAKGRCEVCHKRGHLELHHILRRKVVATEENCIMLCQDCHRGTRGIHGRDGHQLDLNLKQRLQKFYLKTFDDDKTRRLMGGKLY